MPDFDRPLFRTPAASKYLQEEHGIDRAPSTLAKLRCVSSSGPTFRKINREVVYTRPALDEYAKSLLSEPLRSTSDRVNKVA